MAIKSKLIGGGVIDGVDLKTCTMHTDSRGVFTEVFQDAWGTVIDPCQWSVVSSEANVFRGCHIHFRHDEYFCLLSGEALVGLRDERASSPTLGHWQLYHLFGEDIAALTFPAGIVHGWYFQVASMHLQAVSESYLDYGHDDNIGVHWSDPALQIPWGISDPELAERAAGFGSLEEMRKQMALS